MRAFGESRNDMAGVRESGEGAGREKLADGVVSHQNRGAFQTHSDHWVCQQKKHPHDDHKKVGRHNHDAGGNSNSGGKILTRVFFLPFLKM